MFPSHMFSKNYSHKSFFIFTPLITIFDPFATSPNITKMLSFCHHFQDHETCDEGILYVGLRLRLSSFKAF